MTLTRSKIRGAPAIASLAALAVAQNLSRALKQSPAPSFLESPQSLKEYIWPILDYLYTSRPTAVNLGAAIRRLRATLIDLIANGSFDVRSITEHLIKEAHLVSDEDVGRNKKMSQLGAEWLLAEVEKGGRNTENGGLNVYVYCVTHDQTMVLMLIVIEQINSM